MCPSFLPIKRPFLPISTKTIIVILNSQARKQWIVPGGYSIGISRLIRNASRRRPLRFIRLTLQVIKQPLLKQLLQLSLHPLKIPNQSSHTLQVPLLSHGRLTTLTSSSSNAYQPQHRPDPPFLPRSSSKYSTTLPAGSISTVSITLRCQTLIDLSSSPVTNPAATPYYTHVLSPHGILRCCGKSSLPFAAEIRAGVLIQTRALGAGSKLAWRESLGTRRRDKLN